MKNKKKKLYCYVDETGQDAGSSFFVIVSIVSEKDQEKIRQELIYTEKATKLGIKKWHSSRSPEKEEFLRTVIGQGVAKGEVYYNKYKKPLPFFLPMLETIEKAIKDKVSNKSYKAIIYVDGIDKKKASELTGALRLRGIQLTYVRSCRDESEPLIRLADRWAGCIRDALEGKNACQEILLKAEKENYIKQL